MFFRKLAAKIWTKFMIYRTVRSKVGLLMWFFLLPAIDISYLLCVQIILTFVNVAECMTFFWDRAVHLVTVKFLNFRTPKNFAVIYLKFKQKTQTLGYLVKKMPLE